MNERRLWIAVDMATGEPLTVKGKREDGDEPVTYLVTGENAKDPLLVVERLFGKDWAYGGDYPPRFEAVQATLSYQHNSPVRSAHDDE